VNILNPDIGMSLYRQLADHLRRRIASGEFPVGSTLPSESRLMSDHGVSRVTARQAVGLLVNEGLVTRGSGRGTRVVEVPAGRAGQHFRGSLSDLMHEAKRTSTRNVLIERDVVPPSSVGEALELTGSRVTRVSRARYLDGTVFAYSVDHLPSPVGELISEDVLVRDSLMGALMKSGVRMSNARQAITAEVADAETALRLEVRPGDPVLAVDRIILDADHRPIYHVRTAYRADRYAYMVELELDDEAPMAHSALA
jgi:GntR family transcriptional regulator